METRWLSERLTALIGRAGITQPQAAKATGISAAAIHAYCRNWTRPSLSSIITFADFFAVPLDFFFDRCDEEQAREILRDYAAHFMELRRAAYEDYLSAGRKPLSAGLCGKYESPWPYNLVDAIIGEPADWIMTDDHMAALDFALNGLTDRERGAVLLYYQRGEKLDDVAKELGRTRERARQVIHSALKKMRHPSRIRALRVGLKTAQGTETAEARVRELETQIRRLESELSERSAAYEALVPDESFLLSTPVTDLGLSVRSTNCLWRAGYDTLGKILDAAENGKLKTVRNLGRKSMEEVLDTLRDMTGRDCRKECRL